MSSPRANLRSAIGRRFPRARAVWRALRAARHAFRETLATEHDRDEKPEPAVQQAPTDDAQWLAWSATQIREYVAATEEPRLHLGCGPAHLERWLNTDVVRHSPTVVYLDCGQPLPLPDASFATIFSEHQFEHFDFSAGAALLAECHRILKPDGVLRMVMPDLRRVLSLFMPEPPDEGLAFRDWFLAEYMPECPGARDVFLLNGMMHLFGHRFLYDRELIAIAVERAGFVDVSFAEPGKSRYPFLTGLDARPRGPYARYNDFESLIIEARKS